MTEIKTLYKEIHRIMIRYPTFEIVLHNRHNNFYAPVTPSWRDLRERKQANKQKKKQAQRPSGSSYLNKGTEDMNKQNTKA